MKQMILAPVVIEATGRHCTSVPHHGEGVINCPYLTSQYKQFDCEFWGMLDRESIQNWEIVPVRCQQCLDAPVVGDKEQKS
jgi:hypothetical protein